MNRTSISASGRRLTVLAALSLLTVLAVAMVLVRLRASGTSDGAGLIWNLFLAWIPLALALAVYDGHRRRRSWLRLVLLGGLWLLFFPNAPYLVTDLKYLGVWTGVPRLYDIVLLAEAALTGLFLGFVSLYLLHAVVRARLGAGFAWLFALAALGLCSFGLYLGRYARWNSWDLFTRPRHLLGELAQGFADPLAYRRVFAITALFALFLIAAYLAFYALRPAGLDEGDERR